MKEYIVTEHPCFPYGEPKPQELIRCKDCKHKYIEDKVWRCPFGLPGGPDFWCGYGAERKEE